MSTLERDNIAWTLRCRREAAGLSQQALGRQFGVPGQLLGEWERGEVTPGLASLLRWARALDCRVAVVEPVGREIVSPVTVG